MIRRSDIFPAGVFGKPHGINGEINAMFDPDVDVTATDCVIVDIDGIYVPFFIFSVRPKGNDACLLTIEGIDDEVMAKGLVNRQIFMRESERENICGSSDSGDADDGMYAADLIGFEMISEDHGSLGRIVDIDDSTANVLFVVSRQEGGADLLVPVADEFITDINTATSTVTVDLPDGLI